MTNKERILNALSTGESLTIAQLKRTRVENISETIRSLRKDGYAVYGNTNAAGNTTYRLGTPSRAMIAAAYKFGGSSLFN